MKPNAHLSTILILGKDNRWNAYSHTICDSAEEAEQTAAQVLPILAEKNSGLKFIHRTMPFQHVQHASDLKNVL